MIMTSVQWVYSVDQIDQLRNISNCTSGGGAKYLGPGLVKGVRNLGKTSGHGCYFQEGWEPVMRNDLPVLGPNRDSRQH